jgi:glutaredoxin
VSISVEIFSRHGCHLCEVAEEVIRDVQKEVSFDLRVTLIDDSPDLTAKYGEEVPVTLINGERHDYFRIDRDRFKNALLRQHR